MLVWVLKSIGIFLGWLPVRVQLFIGDLIGFAWYYVLPIRRQTVRENLKACFPHAQEPEAINRMTRNNYRHYGRMLVEILRSFSWNQDDYLNEVHTHGLEHVQPFIDSGQGGVLLTCHLGNWEVEIGSAAASGVPFDLVVKRSASKTVDDILKRYRSKMGVNIFYETGTAKDILRAISKGRFVGFILDQFMGPPIGLPVKFFGRTAGTAAALALMSEKRSFPIIPVHSYRDTEGRLHTVFRPPLDFSSLAELPRNERLYQKTQRFNDSIEMNIRSFPEQWLWLHRRWKMFNGVPKWLPESVKVCFLSFLLLAGCSSKPESSPTGIELPPDKKVEIPVVIKRKDGVKAEKNVKKNILEAITKKSAKKSKAQPEKEAKKNEEYEIEPVDRIPFNIGEQMVIDLRWLMLPAGKATLEVRSHTGFQERPTLHLWGRVLSSKLVDTIYHVDNSIESIVDREGFFPYKFLLHMNETHQKKETKVQFDHKNGKANYWAKRISDKWGPQSEDRWDELVPQARDMYSALYYARILDYELGKKVSFYVYENGRNWQIELVPEKRELIRVPVGTFQCLKIKVTVKLNNVLSQVGDMFLWLSDDSKRYLVKFDAKIKIGSMIGTLVELREGK